MLRGLRKASSNWLGKVIMIVVVGFLVVSFAIWGIGDIFRGFGRSTVATVGSTEIGYEQFRQIYTEQLQRIGAQIGRPVTPDQARSAGIDRQILQQLISETALDERARVLGLGVTDETVAQLIHAMPAFQGANGQFNPVIFQQRIRNAGYNEQRFVTEQRRFIIRNQLTDSIGGGVTAPKVMLDAANRFQNEKRTIEFITLGAAQAGDIPAPTPEQISTYYDEHKGQFRAPEYRKIVVLPLSNADVAKWIQISDADAQKYYDTHKSRYITTGERQLQQIIFPSMDEAKAAKARIDAGVPFTTIATERGLSEKEIDTGLVGKSALAPAVAEAAFALPEGGVSDPVQARAGIALVKVLKIEPDRTRTFDEAKEEVKTELRTERTRTEISDKHDKIEDERAAGSTLAEAAQKIGVVATTIDAVDRNGRDPSGAPVVGLPSPEILAQAFTTDSGVETDPIRLPDGGYIWFEVAGVTPSHERKLDEVREDATQKWRDAQVAERLKKRADELLAKLKAGTTLADLATAEGVKVETANDLHRRSADTAPSPAVLTAVF
ncbi:MAG: SurA N-terminal domain-containing protein, partial [Rhizobiales bacterium]|nr:SurA N-terminal domain-containing protein [Hyphomicrobiales bacterium]